MKTRKRRRKLSLVRLLRYMRSHDDVYALEPYSLSLVDELFRLLDRIEPLNDNNYKIAWIKVPCGGVDIEDHGNVDRACEYYMVDNPSELQAAYEAIYDEPYYWFEIETASYKESRVISFGHFTISLDKDRISGVDYYEHDYSELLQWMIDSIRDVIRECEEGTYNDRIEKELPYTLRNGTLSRKVYWDHHPDLREHRLKTLTKQEIDDFITLISTEEKIPSGRIKDMTFNKYFAYASLAFENAGLPVKDLNLFEQFVAFAEDFGNCRFRHTDIFSPEAFNKYYNGEDQMGGHPWGLRRGSSRSRIMLYPMLDEGGYYFRFGGDPNWSVFEIVKMYPPIKKAGMPVVFSQPEETIAYLREEDKIGFVSERDIPVYRQRDFKERINDFYHFQPRNDAPIKDLIDWYPVQKVTLKKDGGKI